MSLDVAGLDEVLTELEDKLRRTAAQYEPLAQRQAEVAAELEKLRGELKTLNGVMSEFHQRQAALANVLHSLNASAYIVEPGANGQYFANVSSREWGLSERPLLFAFSYESEKGGKGKGGKGLVV